MSHSNALFVLGLLAAGCGVTRTVALEDANRYANRETVVTREGYELHWDDGGHLAPAARDGLCLVDAGEGEIRVGGGYVPLHLLAGEPGVVCARNSIRRPLSAFVEGDTLTIVGSDEAVRAPTRALVGIRVHGPNNGAGRRVATEMSPSSELAAAHATEANSVPLIVFGSLIMAVAALLRSRSRRGYSDDRSRRQASAGAGSEWVTGYPASRGLRAEPRRGHRDGESLVLIRTVTSRAAV